MSRPDPKYRRPLNDKQVLLLKVIYKFRFVTVELMCRRPSKVARNIMRDRLKVLADQEYIGRRFSHTDRLRNNHAAYHLKARGIKALAAASDLSPSVLHAAYKDKTASAQFVRHSLRIFNLYRKFEQLSAGSYKFLTKSEITGYDYYPPSLPDIHLIDTADGHSYFLYIAEAGTPPFVSLRKLKRYLDHWESGDWEEAVGGDYPDILLVCATPGLEKGLARRAAGLLYDSDADNTIYTTTFHRLMGAGGPNDPIWTDVTEPGELTSLKPSSD